MTNFYMSYQKIEPVEENRMHRQKYKGHNTICQVLREIYDLSENDSVRLKCRLAMAMAKKMHERLKEYKQQTSEGKGNKS